jgi:hypothetical protein
MESTCESLCKNISDQAVRDLLSVLGSDEEVDIFKTISDLCTIIVPLISDDDLAMICKFFGRCLAYGDKSMCTPLYSIAAKIVEVAPAKALVVSALKNFTIRVRQDKSEARRSYREMYLAAYSETAGPDFIDLQVRLPSLNLEYWPELSMFERIVAVKIPHLFELNQSEVSAISITDLNAFPPLLPFDPSLLSNAKFKNINSCLAQYRFEPFCSYWELTTKLLASLVQSDDLAEMRQPIHLEHLNCKATFEETLAKIEIKAEPQVDDYQDDMEHLEEEKQEEEPPAADPYAFMFLKPMKFVPAVNEINLIGNELFEEDQEHFTERLDAY